MKDGSEKIVIPDSSINCQIKSRQGNSFINAPQFVLEVLSPSTAKYDGTEKKRFTGQKKYQNTGLLICRNEWSKNMTLIMIMVSLNTILLILLQTAIRKAYI